MKRGNDHNINGIISNTSLICLHTIDFKNNLPTWVCKILILTGKDNTQFKNPEKELHRKFTCLQITRYQSTMRETNGIERLLNLLLK